MFYSSIIKKLVYFGENKILGCVKDVKIDYATGKILELSAGSFLKLKKESAYVKNIKIEEDRILFLDLNNKSVNAGISEAGNIINKEVYTESEEFLGRVKDFKIDLRFWRLADIRVKSFSSSKKLIIGEEQIVSIDKEKIIVKDGIIEDAVASAA